MSRFKDLKSEFGDAKYRVGMAEKKLQQVLEQMVKAGMAKVVPDQDDNLEIYIVGEKRLLDDIQYMAFDGEDYEFWGVDADGRAEAEEQKCDPSEFCDMIILAPGESIEWYIKRR